MITPLQTLWLHSRGGRTFDDIVISGRKLYTVMRSRNKDVLIKIPRDDHIKSEYKIVQSIPPRDKTGNSYLEIVLRGKYQKNR